MTPGGQEEYDKLNKDPLDNLHVTALNPGSDKLGLKVSKETDGGFVIEVSGADGYRRTIRVTPELKLKK